MLESDILKGVLSTASTKNGHYTILNPRVAYLDAADAKRLAVPDTREIVLVPSFTPCLGGTWWIESFDITVDRHNVTGFGDHTHKYIQGLGRATMRLTSTTMNFDSVYLHDLIGKQITLAEAPIV